MNLNVQLFNEVTDIENGPFHIRVIQNAGETYAFVGKWYSEDFEISDLTDLDNLIALLTKAREYFVK